jgi:hypothetical protein
MDDHIKKKKRCQGVVADVEPTITIPVIQAHTEILNSNVTINNTTNTTNIRNRNIRNNNYTIIINNEARKLRSFPDQHLDHISDDLKKELVEEARREGGRGLPDAIRKLFGHLYFDMDTPHNVNIMMDNVQVIEVYNASADNWSVCDKNNAIEQMLIEHGKAIDEFQNPAPRPDDNIIRKAVNRGAHMSPELKNDLGEFATEKLQENYKEIEPFSNYIQLLFRVSEKKRSEITQ